MRLLSPRLIAAVAASVAATGVVAKRFAWKATEPTARTSVTLAGDAIGELASRLSAGRAVLGGLRFVGQSAELDSASDSVLVYAARVLAMMPGTFLVESHVTPSGDVLADQSLSDRRASVVRDLLIRKGVAANKLFAMGFGGAQSRRERTNESRVEVSRMPR